MQRFALIDQRLMEDTRFMRRTVGLPHLLHPKPILDPAQAIGTALRDNDGLWRMWYISFKVVDKKKYPWGVDYCTHLAYSRDGIHWKKPALNLMGSRGYKPNNLILGNNQTDKNGRFLTGHGGSNGMIVIDSTTHPHPKARARFTAIYTAYPDDSIGGVLLADSEDGIHWEAWPENPMISGGLDTTNTVVYDPAIGKYVCYHRPAIYAGVSVHANRKIARAESDDLIHWSPGQVVLDADEVDCPAWEVFDEPGFVEQRGRVIQFQGLTPWIANGCYLGLTWTYDSRVGTFVSDIVHSYDGIDWRREGLREPLVVDGRPAGFHGKWTLPMGSPPVLVGDEEYFYMGTSPIGHHDVARAENTPGGMKLALRKKYLETTNIYAMAVKRDRWISYDACDREGELLSRPFKWEGGIFSLNAKIEKGGYIRVEFEDQWARPIKDWHLDEIPPIRGPLDAVDHRLTFGPGPKTLVKFPSVGPIRVRFFLKQAKLFGWSLS